MFGESRSLPEENWATAPPTHLALEDLTAAARVETGEADPVLALRNELAGPEWTVAGSPAFRFARALSRRSHFHVLVVGDRGVGKTSLVRSMAAWSARGEPPHLRNTRFVRLDAGRVDPEEGGALLTAVFSQLVAPLPTEPGQTTAPLGTGTSVPRRLVFCLDDAGKLLKTPTGRSRVPQLVSGLRRSHVPLVLAMTRWEYNELLSGQAEIGELCTRIDLEEPSEEQTREIVARHVPKLEREFGTTVSEPIQRRAISLTSSFWLSERQPAKTLRILRHACENMIFDRWRGGRDQPVERPNSTGIENSLSLSEDQLLDVVSETTGIPRETLSGGREEMDYQIALEEAVVGQKDAVRIASRELRTIRSGLTDPGKPASVLLFAGLTGVGKTELAKRIAELYSASRRLNVYSMGNFTEPHTVSGILGVPPGYVGHEAGGRLINELNADPYSVFLLDEAEKAHPNVWKPFLNLFDEGWIEDPRGARAWADRAIFILTTNAGSDQIAQMQQNGAAEAEIEERVKSTLSRIRHERSTQPVFTPQFLSRIKRILVFRPLDQDAMQGIARKMVRKVARNWLQKKNVDPQIDDGLVDWIGRRAHRLNAASGNKEGGRIIRKLIADVIESPIQDKVTGLAIPLGDNVPIHVSIDNTAPPSDDILPTTRVKIGNR